MGANMSYFKIVILKGSLDNINRLIKADIDIIQKTVDKTKINLDKIDQDITNFGKTLDDIKRDMQTVKSDEVQKFYNVANTNFDILKKLNSVLIKNNSTLEIPNIYTPTSSVNIPNSLPINNIISTNKDLITSSDTSKLYNTVEGLTNYISSYYNNMPIIEGLTDTDMTNINTLMNKEKELVDQLAEFNSKYERYIHCNDSTNNCTNERDSLKPILSSKMTAINNNLTTMTTASSSLSQTSNYQSIHNSILSDYDKVLKIRNDLDMKVKQLYDPENSKIADFKHSYDSTIYSGIIISALATSMLYYIFTEL